MAKLGDFRVAIIGQDKLSPAAATARRSTERLTTSQTRLKTATAGLTSSMKMLLPYLGGTAIIMGMTKMISMTADAGDKFAKMSRKIGLSVETLSTFDHVAKISGITIDIVSVGMRRFAQNAIDMSRGIGEAKREFEELGISVRDSSGNIRTMESLLLEVADRFSKMEDGTTKTAMAMRLFGRSGSEMIPMLNLGKEGIQDLMEEARRLGLVFDEETAQAMERFNDNMTRMKGQLKGLMFFIGEKVIPPLSRMLEMLGFAGKQTEIQKFEEAIRGVKEEIAELEVLLGSGVYARFNRVLMSQEAVDLAKERLAGLRNVLMLYTQDLEKLKAGEQGRIDNLNLGTEALNNRTGALRDLIVAETEWNTARYEAGFEEAWIEGMEAVNQKLRERNELIDFEMQKMADRMPVLEDFYTASGTYAEDFSKRTVRAFDSVTGALATTLAAVLMGERASTTLCFIFWVLFSGIVIIIGNFRFISFISLIYPFMIVYLWVRRMKPGSTYWAYPYINTVLGGLLFFLGAFRIPFT